MEAESFCPVLDPFHTDMIKIIRECLLEGTHSTKNIKTEPYKLSVNGTHFPSFTPSQLGTSMLLTRKRVVRKASSQYSAEREDVWVACDRLFDSP